VDVNRKSVFVKVINESHLPPHNVRLKPLFVKAGKKEEEKVSGQNSSERRDNRKRGWSGRTVFHVRHRRSVPLGKIRVEGTTSHERCRRMSVPWWTQSKNK